MQTVQELCKRPGLNRSGFDMPTIYLPEANGAKVVVCHRQHARLIGFQNFGSKI